mmetsp:Transcript_25738/g.57897  ORF Transcript_25738/g.57897 Transcript_25738/m.57897 type:complete len:237 (+) Transcript_25738:1983-2693(+)
MDFQRVPEVVSCWVCESHAAKERSSHRRLNMEGVLHFHCSLSQLTCTCSCDEAEVSVDLERDRKVFSRAVLDHQSRGASLPCHTLNDDVILRHRVFSLTDELVRVLVAGRDVEQDQLSFSSHRLLGRKRHHVALLGSCRYPHLVSSREEIAEELSRDDPVVGASVDDGNFLRNLLSGGAGERQLRLQGLGLYVAHYRQDTHVKLAPEDDHSLVGSGSPRLDLQRELVDRRSCRSRS